MSFQSRKDTKFLYIFVYRRELKVAALVDTGSSINMMSKNFYDSISEKSKILLERL